MAFGLEHHQVGPAGQFVPKDSRKPASTRLPTRPAKSAAQPPADERREFILKDPMNDIPDILGLDLIVELLPFLQSQEYR